ncbi:MAG TPA: CRISPR-associated endonuclease Cas1, partial [Methylococcaceae bacterium]|nr:CRISPR-associated endonuclease Cas1 [Methylococcaceae bacterium]
MKQALNTLYVTTPEAYLRLEGETVCVMIEKQKKMQVPLHHLGAFVLFDNVMLSPALLGRCAEDGRSVVWLNRSGRFRARLEGPVNGNVLLRQAQYRAADDRDKSLMLAKRFIAGKIRNSRQLLMR